MATEGGTNAEDQDAPAVALLGSTEEAARLLNAWIGAQMIANLQPSPGSMMLAATQIFLNVVAMHQPSDRPTVAAALKTHVAQMLDLAVQPAPTEGRAMQPARPPSSLH